MRASIEDLRAFVRVVELGTFHRAAADLSLTQSALSRRLRKLEEVLGARVLDRTSRRVELTPVGVAFLPAARGVIGHMERALGDIRELIEMRGGTVTVAAVPTVAYSAMASVIAKFQAAQPGMRVRLIDEGGATVAESVASGEAEFGIVIEDEERAELRSESVLRDPYVLACRADHPLAAAQTVRWSELGRHRFITMGPDSLNQRTLARALTASSALPEGVVEVQHLFTILGLLRDGVGIAALPAMSLARAIEPGIVVRPLSGPLVERSIGIVTKPGRSLSPAAALLRSLAVEELRALVAQRS